MQIELPSPAPQKKEGAPVVAGKAYRWWLVTRPMPQGKEHDWEENVVDARPLHPDFMIGQLEKCPTTGTLHWHFVLHSKGPSRASALIKAFPKGDIKTITPGTEQRVIAYVTKDETRVKGPFTFGQCPVKRNSADDWAAVKEHAKNGQLDLIPPEIYVRNFGNLERIAKANLSLRRYNHHRVRGVWIHGESGLGKTHFANVVLASKFGEPYDKLINKWFDGYLNQALIVMNDIDLSHTHQLQHLKLWADRFSFIGEAKGGAMIPRHHVFVVTSNHSIDDIFSTRTPDKNNNDKAFSKADVRALKRRFIEFEMYGKEQEAALGTNRFVDLRTDREYDAEELASFLFQTFSPPDPVPTSTAQSRPQIMEPESMETETLEPAPLVFSKIHELELIKEEWLPIQ